MSYLMESAEETRRLLAQEAADPARVRLQWAGLGPGMSALDAGCGPGLVSLTMADLVGQNGQVVGIDASAERIAEASARAEGRANVEFRTGDVRATGLLEDAFDFVWSQFVFEYLRDADAALAELVRVTRPGGTVAVADIDGAGLLNWPFPEALQEDTRKFLQAIAPTGFDIHAGRKMFARFRHAGLLEVRVQAFSHYVVAGEAPPPVLQDWTIRFKALEPIAAKAFGGPEGYRAFTDAYLGLLRDDGALKYSVVLVTAGRKR